MAVVVGGCQRGGLAFMNAREWGGVLQVIIALLLMSAVLTMLS